jgi:hypothetical protein
MGMPPVRLPSPAPVPMEVEPVEPEVPEPVSPVNNERDPLLGEAAVQRIIDT